MNKPAVLIETQNASIDTLSVTIRSLHVNSKQMTLAVFRQLPHVRVYRDDGTLMSLERWGLVRYEIKDDGRLWLVASHEGVLYRGDVYWFRYEFMDESVMRQKAHIAQLQDEFVRYKQWESPALQYHAAMEFYENQRKELEAACPFKHSDDYLGNLDRDKWIMERMPERPKYVPEIDLNSNRFLYTWKVGMSQEYEELIDGNGEKLKVMETANRSYKELMALPQLFIAV